MSAEPEYDLFVSYAREDEGLVRRLVERLRTDGYTVWHDEQDLRMSSTLRQELAEAIGNCNQLIACMSESYFNSDYARLELDFSLKRDPRNREGRTLAVEVRELAKGAVHLAYDIHARAKLWDPEIWEREYSRLKRSIRPRLGAAGFMSAARVARLRKLPDTDAMLGRMIRAAKEMFSFIYRRELPTKAALPETLGALAENLIKCQTVEKHVRTSIETVWRIAELIEDASVDRKFIEPGLASLMTISEWATDRYNVRHSEGVGTEDLWETLRTELMNQAEHDRPRIPGTEILLGEGEPCWCQVGAFFDGKGCNDSSQVDLLLAPLAETRVAEFRRDVDLSRRLPEEVTIPVRYAKVLSLPVTGIWGVIVLDRTEGVALADLLERFSPLPVALGLAICRRISQSLKVMHASTPPAHHGFLTRESILVDADGRARVNRIGRQNNPEAGKAIRGWPRERFWFGGSGKSSPEGAEDGVSLKTIVQDILSHCETDDDLVAFVASATTIDELVAILEQAPRGAADEESNIGTAVDCFRENKALPSWLSTGESALTPAPEVKPDRMSLSLCVEIDVVAQAAWPLGDSHVLAWRSDGLLEVFENEDGKSIWHDERPIRIRCVAPGPDGRLAVGAWDGRMFCFKGGELEQKLDLGWTIGALEPHRDGWLAGTWRGRLVLVGNSGGVDDLLGVTDGVFRIATSPRDEFAVMDLRGAVSYYREGERSMQTRPIEKAHAIALLGGRLFVLVDRGLVTISSQGDISPPDRLPARRGFRLVSRVAGRCLLVADDGRSWEVDSQGTYPPATRFPPGRDTDVAAVDPIRCSGPERLGGYAYLRDGVREQGWSQALFCSISSDGTRIAVTNPGSVQLYEDPL